MSSYEFGIWLGILLWIFVPCTLVQILRVEVHGRFIWALSAFVGNGFMLFHPRPVLSWLKGLGLDDAMLPWGIPLSMLVLSGVLIVTALESGMRCPDCRSRNYWAATRCHECGKELEAPKRV